MNYNYLTFLSNFCTDFIDIFSGPFKTVYNFFPKNLHFHRLGNQIRHFRAFADRIEATTEAIRKEGIQDRYLSGSGQFDLEPLKQLIEKINTYVTNKKILVIDLRQEPHGFINKEAVVWKIGTHGDGNKGKSTDVIKSEESHRLISLPKIFLVFKKVFNFLPFPKLVRVHTTLTEEQAIQQLGNENIHYHRIPITDHCRPTDKVVDELVALINANPNSWLHFHCAVGKGRTTTAMAIFDMLYNAKELTLQEILKRQAVIGGEDLNRIHSKSNKEKPEAKERLEFLTNFYCYCREADPKSQTWTDWVELKQLKAKLI